MFTVHMMMYYFRTVIHLVQEAINLAAAVAGPEFHLGILCSTT